MWNLIVEIIVLEKKEEKITSFFILNQPCEK